MSAWDEGRPIFKRLPQYGWQDNAVADWVTDAYDRVLMELQAAILNFPEDFIDPDTCRVDALDWLAQLSGFTGEYWDAEWPEAIKRQLIKDAQMIWAYKGTQYLLQYMLDLFGITQARIVIRGAFQASISRAGDSIGDELLTYSIVVGTETTFGYTRSSYEWRLIERLNRLYMPCWLAPSTASGGFLHYQRFRAGFSVAGDPL